MSDQVITKARDATCSDGDDDMNGNDSSNGESFEDAIEIMVAVVPVTTTSATATTNARRTSSVRFALTVDEEDEEAPTTTESSTCSVAETTIAEEDIESPPHRMEDHSTSSSRRQQQQQQRSSSTSSSSSSSEMKRQQRKQRLLRVRQQRRERERELLPALEGIPCWSVRLTILNVAGVVLILGGIAWATWHSMAAPRYETTTTGQPTGALVCSNRTSSSSSSSLSAVNDTADISSRNREDWEEKAHQEVCQELDPWQRPCYFAIFYNFTIHNYDPSQQQQLHVLPDGDAAAEIVSPIPFEGNSDKETNDFYFYSGVDLVKFANNNNNNIGNNDDNRGNDYNEACHDQVDTSRAAFLATTNLTIYYNPHNPGTDNYVQQPTPPATMAGIIAGMSCGLGILLLCLSFLEHMC